MLKIGQKPLGHSEMLLKLKKVVKKALLIIKIGIILLQK